MPEKKKCFIIQPLADEYKERCDETYKPAIKKAGLEPYRIDEHYTAVKMKIQSIEEEIEKSAVCLADITENNPNVWYEVGFADGRYIPVVLICNARKRDKLPFDVNQRDTCFYNAESRGGREELQEQITTRLKIAVREAPEIAKSRNKDIDSHGGSEYGRAELVMLKALHYGSNVDSLIGRKSVLEAHMEHAGLESMDIIDAFSRLEMEKMVDFYPDEPFISNDHVYMLTERGARWCLENTELLRGLEK